MTGASENRATAKKPFGTASRPTRREGENGHAAGHPAQTGPNPGGATMYGASSQSDPAQGISAAMYAAEHHKRSPMPTELPAHYGTNHIHLMVRDPHWLLSYWEIRKEHEQQALQSLGGSWEGVTTVLRIHDSTEGEDHSRNYAALPPGSRNWYINVEPNRDYWVEIGLLHHDGRYVSLARSNTVRTPRAGMSEIIDEEWMDIDFEKMYALSGGFEVGRSSLELQQAMEERLRGAISSGSGMGAISSLASPVKAKPRGFWFMLDCELIVYGATEPDAKVTFKGKEVKLRPDGTFSLRFALPDGHYRMEACAESADGIEKRTIIPTVQRKTESREPVLQEH
jgi:hypothetical protein